MTNLENTTNSVTPPSQEEARGGACWLGGRFGAFRPEGCKFDSNYSRHVRTLGKFFTQLPVALRHVNSGTVSNAAVGAPLNSSGFEEAQ